MITSETFYRAECDSSAHVASAPWELVKPGGSGS